MHARLQLSFCNEKQGNTHIQPMYVDETRKDKHKHKQGAQTDICKSHVLFPCFLRSYMQGHDSYCNALWAVLRSYFQNVVPPEKLPFAGSSDALLYVCARYDVDASLCC